jgi:hypothetical protein
MGVVAVSDNGCWVTAGVVAVWVTVSGRGGLMMRDLSMPFDFSVVC